MKNLTVLRLRKMTFFNLVSSHRNGSCPGPNCILYKVYKKCSNLADYLYESISMSKCNGKVPPKWGISFTSFVPKVENPDRPNIFYFK